MNKKKNISEASNYQADEQKKTKKEQVSCLLFLYTSLHQSHQQNNEQEIKITVEEYVLTKNKS